MRDCKQDGEDCSGIRQKKGRFNLIMFQRLMDALLFANGVHINRYSKLTIGEEEL